MHYLFSIVFENSLIFPPITRPRRILECGFGTGDWAIEVAQQHPSCEVVGIDICPHIWPDEAQTPPNLNLQVDDLNGRFTFPSNHFDLVHSQMMAGGIHSNRWRDYLRDIHRVLRPGGWVQTVEIYFNAQSDNGTLTQNHALRRWSRRYLDSMQPYKDPRAPLQMQSWMQSAGFDSVETQMIPLPTCGWSNGTESPDTRLQIIDANQRCKIHGNIRSAWQTERTTLSNDGVPGVSFEQPPQASVREKQLTALLYSMTSQEFQVLVAQARSEADNPEFRGASVVEANHFLANRFIADPGEP
ncbi:hypothetical protein GCG54_00001884 [Colletotrichum gloeosporioides]|uniref:Methyltransferase domain-containing protein n=1 Tax=Colletotrichum gloeosporioides TaxID=474922 RepID=A0A8H4CWX2_COLGL|nr:uncharacterized protein GCG54_00001884 [Colletotrichum gloeosporioides]KAF3811556.1 hypothetical protein GCG54_00001884 [Colletotrichum gloeosporioides]